MPEGDTLHRTAARLRPALEGAELLAFEAPRLLGERPRAGITIGEVVAIGKHLLVRFDDGLTLRTHLGMPGSWHLYAAGQRWRKPRHLLRVRLEVPGWDAVCFSAPQVQTYRGPDEPVAHLGPDLCRADADLDDAVRRFAQVPEPGTPVAVALLDQRIAAGIGNVYKSEVLHRCRLSPFTPVEQVPEATRRRLLEEAAGLLRHNLTTTRRTTVAGPPGSLAVYGRARRPCRVCGTLIRVARQGEQARSTYWCPRCQAG